MQVRPPAVAGTFYPASAHQLRQDVAALLAAAPAPELDAGTLKALIAPHAGYVYSGPIAASAYRLLESRRRQIRRVLLLGPSHRVALRGIAAPSVDCFRTPLGDIALDRQALASLEAIPGFQYRDDAHAWEHSLEVHLPFLQATLDDFTLVPLVVGLADADSVSQLLARFWDEADTLIVVSSDLSHFHPYENACQLDGHTSGRIEALDSTLAGEEACGCYPLNGLLQLARQRGASIRTLDLRNSGDTAGSRDQVVGYGSYAVCA